MYSYLAIKLPLKQNEFFLNYIFPPILIGLNAIVHTNLSRKNSTLKTKFKRIGLLRGRFELVIDSTGLVTYGESRWIRHQYGKRKRRRWRKLHLGSSNGFIVADYLSEYQKTDS